MGGCLDGPGYRGAGYYGNGGGYYGNGGGFYGNRGIGFGNGVHHHHNGMGFNGGMFNGGMIGNFGGRHGRGHGFGGGHSFGGGHHHGRHCWLLLGWLSYFKLHFTNFKEFYLYFQEIKLI